MFVENFRIFLYDLLYFPFVYYCVKGIMRVITYMLHAMSLCGLTTKSVILKESKFFIYVKGSIISTINKDLCHLEA